MIEEAGRVRYNIKVSRLLYLYDGDMVSKKIFWRWNI